MKTVAQVISDYRKSIDANVSPIHGFKVGDRVETTPYYTHGHASGFVVGFQQGIVTFELQEKGTYKFKHIDETYLMPFGTVPKKVD